MRAVTEPTVPVTVVAPTNTAISVFGQATVGRRLTSSSKWTPDPDSNSHQWRRCNPAGVDCDDIEGATSSSLEVGIDDVGSTLVVAVTAGTSGGSTTATSRPTRVVPAPTVTNTEPVSVRFVAGPAGDVAIADPGQWSGQGTITYTYQWQRCTSDGNGCEGVTGARSETLAVSDDDVDHTLRVRVQATDGAGSESQASPPTSAITRSPPASTQPPALTGAAAVGESISADSGLWTGTGILSLARQWQRCDAFGAACQDIAGQTAPDLAVGAADLGATIRLRLTATNSLGAASAVSTASAPVTAQLANGPVNAVVPTITGSAVVGETLSSNTGEWDASAALDFSYQWRRCDLVGDDCERIEGADASTYVLVDQDAGATITVEVLAADENGETGANSAATPIVTAPGAPVNNVPPAVTGTPVETQSLTVDQGQWTSDRPLTFVHQWQTCADATVASCVDVEGITDATYALTADEITYRLRVLTTASDGTRNTTVIGAMTEPVQALAPYATTPPAISGTARSGSTLTADTGDWDGTDPIAYSYNWQSCAPDQSDCAYISGADAATYTVGQGDVGSTLQVEVTATDSGGTRRETSANTDVVAASDAPTATAPPTLSGQARHGTQLSATAGTWTGAGPIGYAYQWQVCAPNGEDCYELDGATGASFVPNAEEIGQTLRVAVTATGSTGSQTAFSQPSALVADDDQAPATLESSQPPSIAGSSAVGATLAADPGVWEGGNTIAYSYRWRRCDSSGNRCSWIDGATAETYRAENDDLDGRLRVSVTAINPWGSLTVTSEPTAVIVAGATANDQPPTIYGVAEDGQWLWVNDGQWIGGELSYTRQWQRCVPVTATCTNIPGATDPGYQLTAGDVGHVLRVLVTADGERGTATAASSDTEVVAQGPPALTYAPSILGFAAEDGVLTVDVGGWDGSAPLVYSYAWQRCDEDGAECIEVANATTRTYTLGAGDVSSTLRIQVTASNAAGTAVAVSDATAPVTGAAVPRLVDDQRPSIDGEANLGRELTARAGAWESVDPLTLTYQWQRCDPTGDACVDISGATSAAYTTQSTDVDATLRVVETASNPTGTATSSSWDRGVTSEAPNAGELPQISGAALPGQVLDVTEGTWAGDAPMTMTYQWQRCDYDGDACVDVDDSTTNSYLIAEADNRRRVRVVVTATNGLGSSVAVSAPQLVGDRGIHNTSPPTLSGDAADGSVLTVDTGAWDPEPFEFRYRWQSCDATGSSCSNIDGATGAEYQVTGFNAGMTLRAVVTATRRWESVVATTAVSGVVQSDLPVNYGAPTLSNPSPVIGVAVTADPGSWTGTQPLSYAYEWQACETGQPCYAIYGEDQQTFTPPPFLLGRSLRVLVTATNSAGQSYYSSRRFSAVSSPVSRGVPENLTAPTLVGDPIQGSTLSIEAGTWSGVNPEYDFTYRWKRCSVTGTECVDIASSQGPGAGYTTAGRDDIGHTLRGELTATTTFGTRTILTEPSASIVALPAPVNQTRPQLTGNARVGEQLQLDPGTWTPSGSIEVDWQRCDLDGGDCGDADPRGSTNEYRLRRADEDHMIRALVTATNAGGSASMSTEASAIVAAAPALVNVLEPRLLSWQSPRTESGVDAAAGSWAGDPDIAAQWQRCDPLTTDPETTEMDCTDIPDATNPSRYVPQLTDVGFQLRVKETATSPGNDTQSVFSPLSGAVIEAMGWGGASNVSGFEAVGQTLTVNTTPPEETRLPVTTTFVFERLGSGEVAQSGSSPTYELTAADQDQQLAITATAQVWRADHAVVLSTTTYDTVYTQAVQPAITNATPPSISGTNVVGATLTADPGGWTGGGTTPSYTYAWQRCSTDGTDCEQIPDTTGDAHELVAQDLGATLRVEVTAAAGTASPQAISAVTAPIAEAEAPVGSQEAAITGTAQELETLSADPGQWQSDAPIRHTYQWQVCDADASDDCMDRSGATGSTYRADAEDVGSVLRVVVTASNPGGASVSVSPPTEVVVAADAPELQRTPSLTVLGPPTPGSTLVTDGGAWQNVRIADGSVQWRRCAATGGACVPIDNAYGRAYTLTPADVGQRLRVRVSVRNSGAQAAAESPSSAAIGTSVGSAAEKLVFVNAARSAVFLADKDGTSAQEVADCASLSLEEGCQLRKPRLSPNLQILAVEARDDNTAQGAGQILLVNYDGTAARRVVDGSDPSWSADGVRLLFTQADRHDQTRTRVAAVNADASDAANPTALLQGESSGHEAEPELSPDGARLTYVDQSDADSPQGQSGPGLYVADSEGADSRRVDTDSDSVDISAPHFSADSQQIYFSAESKTQAAFSGARNAWVALSSGGSAHLLSGEIASTDHATPIDDGSFVYVTERNFVTINFGWGSSTVFRDYATVRITRGGQREPVAWLAGYQDLSAAPDALKLGVGSFFEDLLGFLSGPVVVEIDGYLVPLRENGFTYPLKLVQKAFGIGSEVAARATRYAKRYRIGVEVLLASQRVAHKQAMKLASLLKPAERGFVTMAVGIGKDASGRLRIVVGTNEKNGVLRRNVKSYVASRKFAVARGYRGHAEVQVLSYMKNSGLTPVTVGASRPICPDCAVAIREAGGTFASPLK